MHFERHLAVLFFILAITSAYCQTFTSRLIDAKTGEGIPYATIRYGENAGIITNEEGVFSLRQNAIPENQDSLYISCMGYENMAIPYTRTLDSLIVISPKPIALNEVFLFNQELEVDEIIALVKENLPSNYDQQAVMQRLFFRQSSLNELDKLAIAFKKSTIAELSKEFLDSVVTILPRSAAYYTESLSKLYSTSSEKRLYIEKAAELYDKNNEGSMEALSEKLERIFKENVKPNSYLKIKSGIFGTKMQLDSVFDAEDEAADVKQDLEVPEKSYFLANQKNTLQEIYNHLFYNEDTKVNFLEKPRRYDFALQGYSNIGDAGVYVISFEPKRSADFRGTLYVNIDDFAIMRLDYENVKPLRRIRLLGLSYEEQVYRGTTLFSKGTNDKYALRFAEKVIGRKMGVRRPLKVIEKNKYVKGRRKQNELSMELDISNFNREKYELVVFETLPISTTVFQNTVENENVKATYLSQYDPDFWKGYDIMEPNQAIRSFSASGQ